MSHLYRFIILSGLLLSSRVQAYEIFAEALYWRATEAFDWTYTNDEHLPNQSITYKTIPFHYEPSFRVGISSENNCYTALYYTRFYTHDSDATFGNSISGFIGDRIANFPNGYFFQAGQIDYTINYNMFDADLGKSFQLSKRLTHTPVVGLRGGWINQSFHGKFQGPVSATENVKNNFIGLGPKAGLNTQLLLYCTKHYQLDLFANFTSSYLWGHWKINDVYVDTVPATANIIVPSKNLGAFTTQAVIGLHLNYRDLSLQLGYEIMDWFNQCQFFDNGTGAHSNDLVLQGTTFKMSYNF